MRHNVKKATLNKPADQRKAMLRNLLTALFTKGSLKTTDARARVLAEMTDELVSKTKKQSDQFNAIRGLKQVLFTEESQKKALEYCTNTKKQSGFTRRAKVGHRAGDNALMVQVELINE